MKNVLIEIFILLFVLLLLLFGFSQFRDPESQAPTNITVVQGLKTESHTNNV